jgi:hypothetical protein
MTISEYKANGILDWIQSACHDMAESGIEGSPSADEIYESEDDIYDLLIQRVHDESVGDVLFAISILNQILMISDHDVIKRCCIKALSRMEV